MKLSRFSGWACAAHNRQSDDSGSVCITYAASGKGCVEKVIVVWMPHPEGVFFSGFLLAESTSGMASAPAQRNRRSAGRDCALFDAFLTLGDNDAIHIRAGRMHVVRIKVAGVDDAINLSNGDGAGLSHHGIEIASRHSVDEIASAIRGVGVDEGEVGLEPGLHDILPPGELSRLFALSDERADASRGEERRNAGAASPDALGECALRIELDLKLAFEKLAGELIILADVARNHLADLPGLEKQPEAPVIDAAVVADECEVLHASVAERDDELLGDAAQAEAARHHGHAVADDAVGLELTHDSLWRIEDLIDHGRQDNKPVARGGWEGRNRVE